MVNDLSQIKIYNAYNQMVYRCYNKNSKPYKNYGGRGIKVCNEWLDGNNGLLKFINWSLENGYKIGLTLDRMDVNDNYSPRNCRWVTMKIQQNNKRNNTIIIYKGKKYTISELSDLLNIKFTTISNRIRRGWSLTNITKDIQEELKVEINGEFLTLKEISTKYNLSLCCVRARYARGKKGFELIKDKDNRGGNRE